MVEQIGDLLACEILLKDLLAGTSYIGEVELSYKDIMKLGELLRFQMQGEAHESIRLLWEKVPASFASFIVGIGVWGYENRNYWRAVSDALQLDLDGNCQRLIGQGFLEYLNKNGLFTANLSGAHTYVAQILLHSGVPQQSLETFFKQVIERFFDRGCISLNEISACLLYFRDEEKEKTRIETELNKRYIELEREDRLAVQLGLYIKLKEEINAFNYSPEDIEILDELPIDFNVFVQEINMEIEQIEQKTESLKIKLQQIERRKQEVLLQICILREQLNLLKLCCQLVQDFRQQENIIKETVAQDQEQLRKVVVLSSSSWLGSWNESYTRSLADLDINAIAEHLRTYEEYLGEYKTYLVELHCLITLAQYDYVGSYSIGLERIRLLVEEELNLIRLQKHPDRMHQQPRSVSRNIYNRLLVTYRKLNSASTALNKVSQELQASFKGIPMPDVFHIINNKQVYSFLDELKILKENHIALQECQKYRSKSENKADMIWHELKAAYEQIAAETDMDDFLCVPDNNIEEYNERLKQLSQKYSEIEKEQDDVKKLLNEHEQQAFERKYKLEKNLQQVQESLKKMGCGDLNRGIHELQIKRQAIQRKQKIEKELTDITRALGQEGVIIRPEDETACMSNIHKEKQQIVQRISNQIEEITNHMPHKEMFSGIDEPIYRFLLYGGKWAERLVASCIEFLYNGSSDSLPLRIQQWLENQRYRRITIEDITETGQGLTKTARLSSPYYFLDEISAEVKLIIPQQIISIGKGRIPQQAVYRISNNEDSEQYLRCSIQNSMGDPAKCEISAVEYEVDMPCNCYVELEIDKQVAKSWNVNGLSEETPYMAFSIDGKSRKLNQSVDCTWLVLSPGYRLADDSMVVEELLLRGIQERCCTVKIELKSASSIGLIKADNSIFEIELEKAVTTVGLIGGIQKDNLLVEGIAPYVQVPELLKITIEDNNLIGSWQLFVYKGYHNPIEVNHLYLNEFVNQEIIDGELCIDLEDIINTGGKTCGWYSIAVLGAHWIRQQIDFVVLPYLDYEFDASLYSVQDTANLTLILPADTGFKANAPAQITNQEDDVFIITINASEEHISGEIIVELKEQRDCLSLIIPIPIIKWTLRWDETVILDYRNIREINLDVWDSSQLLLDLAIPAKGTIYAEIGIDGAEQKSETKLYLGKAQFNLLSFRDSLREAEQTLCSFQLLVYKSKSGLWNSREMISQVFLFTVRCRWEVYNAEVIDLDEDQLYIKWDELGKRINPRLLIWDYTSPWESPRQIAIPAGNNELYIDKGSFKTGDYLLEFVDTNNWALSYQKDRYPLNNYNVFTQFISTGNPWIDSLKLDWENSNRVSIYGRAWNLKSFDTLTVLMVGTSSKQTRIWMNSAKIKRSGNFQARLGIQDEYTSGDKGDSMKTLFTGWYLLLIRSSHICFNI